MKIDLHVHTKKCKSGDSNKRNVTSALFKEKVALSGVSVIGITNHNHFDLEQYNSLKEEVKEFCDVWPGVEFDVKQKDSNVGHVIVIVNPKYAQDFNNKVENIVGNVSCDNFVLSIDLLTSSFNSFDPIFIPHYFKPKSLGRQDMELLESKVYLKTRLIKEPSNIVSIGVLNSYNQKCLLGSDVQDWDEYEKGTFSELKYDFFGFENFLKLLDKNVPYINSLLDKTYTNEVEVFGDFFKQKYPFKIKYYNDVNIIFGDRGSGKTEILKSLKYYFDRNSIKSLFYKGGDKEDWFSKLLTVNVHDYSYLNLDLTDNCSSSFKTITEYQDYEPTPISDYFKYFNNLTNNANAKKIKIVSFNKINDRSIDKVNNYKSEYLKISRFIADIKNMAVFKLATSKYENLLKELKQIEIDAFALYRDSIISYYGNYLFDRSIDKINTAISECVGQPQVPTKTGFFDFANSRLNLLRAIRAIKNTTEIREKTLKKDYIGEIGDKGEGHIIETIRFINGNNVNSINTKWQNGKKQKYDSFFKQLEIISNNVFDSKLSSLIISIKSLLMDNQIENIDYFLCPMKTFVVNDNEYNPSKGEKCILSMQYELISQKEEYSVFLIDEPESGLGNDYIEKNIVTLLKDMAHSKKTVFVATHNANVAVRTLPATSILKLVNNDLYTTYQGSMFTNLLINIENNSDIKLWNIESETHLEGGKKAFTERGFYYEGNG